MTTVFLCDTCGVEYAPPLPDVCVICADDRQWVPSDGQRWTDLDALGARGTTLSWTEREPGRFAVTTEPRHGIGQTMQVVNTADGVLLWDPTSFIDEATVERINNLGPVLAIASSHPHMFGVQVEWSRALDAPVLVNDADRQWLQRTDPQISFWNTTTRIGPVTLHQVGGHYAGSAVALWPDGAGCRGTLLTGDTVFPNPDHRTVGFLRSYPNKIPLSAAVVERIADDLHHLQFDKLVGNFDNEIDTNGHECVQFSAQRHAAWVRGDFDHLT